MLEHEAGFTGTGCSRGSNCWRPPWGVSDAQLPLILWLHHPLRVPFGVTTLAGDQATKGKEHGASSVETVYGPHLEMASVAFVPTPKASEEETGLTGS